MVEETKKDIYSKVTGIESRVEKDGKRLIEMEKYKLDLVELRDSIYNRQSNTLDYNRLVRGQERRERRGQLLL